MDQLHRHNTYTRNKISNSGEPKLHDIVHYIKETWRIFWILTGHLGSQRGGVQEGDMPPPVQKAQVQHGIKNILYKPFKRYRRRWLLSACAYKNEQQGNMRLIKNMCLTESVRLIERA